MEFSVLGLGQAIWIPEFSEDTNERLPKPSTDVPTLCISPGQAKEGKGPSAAGARCCMPGHGNFTRSLGGGIGAARVGEGDVLPRVL